MLDQPRPLSPKSPSHHGPTQTVLLNHARKLKHRLRRSYRDLRYGTLNFAARYVSFYMLTPYDVRLKFLRNDATNIFSIEGRYGTRIYNQLLNLQANDMFIDVGANAGLWSLVAAKQIGPKGLVFAIEPQYSLVSTLHDNLYANNIQNVCILPFALGPRTGFSQMSTCATHSGLAHLTPGRGSTVVSDGIFLKQLINDKNFERIHVKVDVEGYELECLKSLEPVLQDTRCIRVIVEIDEDNLARYNCSSMDLYGFMGDLNFLATNSQQENNRHYDEVFLRRPSTCR